ncbi:hypothetical protein F5888DRAFT_1908310, partial [Russula emetica]
MEVDGEEKVDEKKAQAAEERTHILGGSGRRLLQWRVLRRRVRIVYYVQGFISFTLEKLKGVPEDVISGYAKRTESGKELYDVTHKTPDIFPLFKYAQSAETRRRAYESYETRLELNAPLLDRTLELRRNIATLLGYKTWADHVTEVKMVKSGDNIKKFLTDLEQRLRPLAEEAGGEGGEGCYSYQDGRRQIVVEKKEKALEVR